MSVLLINEGKIYVRKHFLFYIFVKIFIFKIININYDILYIVYRYSKNNNSNNLKEIYYLVNRVYI